MFDRDTAIEQLRTADPRLNQVIEQVGPYTLEPQPQGFFTLVDAIISQQISVKAAAAIMRRVSEHVGEVTPANLLAVAPEELRQLGLSNQKARYVLDLAAKVTDGTVDLSHLEALDDELIIQQLVQVKGIGRWTAEMYLIFSLGRPDVLPVDDLGLRQAVFRVYGLAEMPKPAAVRELAEPWRPYRSIATWYLWRSLNNTPVEA